MVPEVQVTTAMGTSITDVGVWTFDGENRLGRVSIKSLGLNTHIWKCELL